MEGQYIVSLSAEPQRIGTRRRFYVSICDYSGHRAQGGGCHYSRAWYGNIDEDALEQNARMLESVLEDFGVRGEITRVRPGPGGEADATARDWLDGLLRERRAIAVGIAGEERIAAAEDAGRLRDARLTRISVESS